MDKNESICGQRGQQVGNGRGASRHLKYQPPNHPATAFYERVRLAPSESMAHTGKIRGMKEGDWCLNFWKIM